MKARDLANKMIQEFLDGGQIQIDPKDYPKEIQGTAIAMARGTAGVVVSHARKARQDPNYINYLQGWKKNPKLGRHIASMVVRYNASRHKRAAA